MTDNYNFGDDDLSWLDATLTPVPAPVAAPSRPAGMREPQWHYPEQYREQKRQQMREAWTSDPERRAKTALRQSTRVITDETRARHRDAQLGRVRSQHTRAKISADNIVKHKRPPSRQDQPHTDTARAKIAHAQWLKWHSTDPQWVEWRAEQLEAIRARPALQKTKMRTAKIYHTPYGEFDSRGDAVEFLRRLGVPNWRHVQAHLHRTQPEQHYFQRERVPK